MSEEKIEIIEAGNDVYGDPIRPEKKKNFFLFLWKNRRAFAFMFLIILCLVIYIWSEVKLRRLENEFEKKENFLKEQINIKLLQNQEVYLKLFIKTFSWTIKQSLIQKDFDQIKRYVKTLQQMQEFEDIIVSDARDKIVASTNYKLEEKDIRIFFPFEFTEPREITMYRQKEKGLLFIAAPVKGLNIKLGNIAFKIKSDVFISD